MTDKWEKRFSKLVGPHYIKVQKMGFRDDETGLWWPKFKCPICGNWFFAFWDEIVLGEISKCPECGEYEPLFLEEKEQEQRRKKSCANKIIQSGLYKPQKQNDKTDIRIKKCASLGEYKIFTILTENKIYFEMQKTFNDCINPKTKAKLRFDFYLPYHNCCIEYDGIQHFEAVDYFGGEEGLKNTIFRDNIKNQYCEEKNINLIRIKYNCKDIKKAILGQLKII